MSQSYAIIPAAGRSRRMGKPKLLLPWGKRTLIDQVLNVWTASVVAKIIVVVRSDDDDLTKACRRWPVELVRPETDPRDMKASVQIGLRHLEEQLHPASDDRCFIAPADLPGLRTDVINRLAESEVDSSTITVPVFGDRQGHPVLFPWPITRCVFDLAEDEGIDRLIDHSRKRTVSFPDGDYFGDLDTAEEYRRSLPHSEN